MTNIVYMRFGSHLYGTDTPSSDIDYKGVYMPSMRQILLADFPNSFRSSTGPKDGKNRPGDVDDEVFSLHRFTELACEGQTVALDMLHAPESMILRSSDIWKAIVANRNKFYTKNLKAFMGYCRRQAAKYGIKGSRLNDARMVMEVLNRFSEDTKMAHLWCQLPEGEHIHFMINDDACHVYQVCGKKFLDTVKVKEVKKSLNSFVAEFGDRAELAAANKGIDWKAVSHALRAAYQLQEIYSDGTITFPLKEAEFVKQVKLGQLDYTTVVAPKLEALIEETELLAESCTLPDAVDKAFWDEFIIDAIKSTYGLHI